MIKFKDLPNKYCRGYEVRVTTEFIPEDNPDISLKEYNKLFPIDDNWEKYGYVYVDTGENVNEVDARSCKECGLDTAKSEPDPCIGKLDNVFCACCGHGDEEKAYAKFNDGKVLVGKVFFDFIKTNEKDNNKL